MSSVLLGIHSTVWPGPLSIASARSPRSPRWPLAVAAVIAGWAAAQEPRLLPGLTVSQAAAGRATLIATIIGVAAGAVVLVPSLTLLYTLVLRGRLEGGATGETPLGPARGRPGIPRARLAGAFAAVTLVAGAGLMIFAAPAWALALGVLALVACAVTVFALAAGPPERS